MLAKFKVSNFKSFNEELSFDLTDTNGYSFNRECIKNNIVNNALVYGHNGVGKSNLGLAIFDIIEHLTDKNTSEVDYQEYLNAYSDREFAEFYYEFRFGSRLLQYTYRKLDYQTITYERLLIDNQEVAYIDRSTSNSATFTLKGTEHLKTELENSELSILKYVKNNTDLDNNDINRTFLEFFKYLEGMLFFRSLQNNQYLGFEVGQSDIVKDIIERSNVQDFQTFLNEAGIECKLAIVNDLNGKALVFDFGRKVVPFNRIASQGTRALLLFYYWFQRIRESGKVSFLFIDEFDAFYHHELSALIVRELKKTGVQFVLTTHNTSIITNDLLRPDCYFLIDKKHIRSLSRSTAKELREAHNIEKMYKAGSFDGK